VPELVAGEGTPAWEIVKGGLGDSVADGSLGVAQGHVEHCVLVGSDLVVVPPAHEIRTVGHKTHISDRDVTRRGKVVCLHVCARQPDVLI